MKLGPALEPYFVQAKSDIENRRKSKNLQITPNIRTLIVVYLNANIKEGSEKVKLGAVAKIAKITNTCERSVRRIHMSSKQDVRTISQGVLGRGKRTRARVPLTVDEIKAVPLEKRRTERSLAQALGKPKSTVHDGLVVLKKKGKIVRRSLALKPTLTPKHKLNRVEFVISHLKRVNNSTVEFETMENVVHIDEKWFYSKPPKQSYNLAVDERTPVRSTQHKSHIPKLMFLAAVARPRPEVGFDGKIGLWVFAEKKPAKRNSKNRPAGTLVTTPVSVKKPEVEAMLKNKVIPAIKERFPQPQNVTRRNKIPIVIQQDNATPHSQDGIDEKFIAESGGAIGLDISLRCQPSQSPDFNILDLGVFAAIDAAREKADVRNLDELIEVAEKAFWGLSPTKLNNCSLSLQQCMIESLKVAGSNTYKQPHMGKEKMEREGTLPRVFRVPSRVVNTAKDQASRGVEDADSTKRRSSRLTARKSSTGGN